MNHQVYISSYARDKEWLRHCLFSLKKFQVGFLPPVVGVAAEDLALIRRIADETFPETTVLARGAPTWMGAQIRMMEADLLCPNADVIYFLGSDCIAFQEFRPEPYCDSEGRPFVLFTPYAQLGEQKSGLQRTSLVNKWKLGTERVLGIEVEFEFMRRIPSVFPRAVFPAMRSHVGRLHEGPFEPYITTFDPVDHGTSEANILGAYAYYFMRESCNWVSTETYSPEDYPSSILHLWSWGNLDRITAPPEDPYVMLSDGLPNYGRTARQIFQKLLYS